LRPNAFFEQFTTKWQKLFTTADTERTEEFVLPQRHGGTEERKQEGVVAPFARVILSEVRTRSVRTQPKDPFG